LEKSLFFQVYPDSLVTKSMSWQRTGGVDDQDAKSDAPVPDPLPDVFQDDEQSIEDVIEDLRAAADYLEEFLLSFRTVLALARSRRLSSSGTGTTRPSFLEPLPQ
jgi:hypothetical protein